MITIQEIMESVYRSQFASSAYEASSGPGTKELEIAMFAADGEVQALIAQAIAEARADGAREMQERAAVTAWSSGMDQHNKRRGIPHAAREVGSECAEAIRALPRLDKREPVRLMDERGHV